MCCCQDELNALLSACCGAVVIDVEPASLDDDVTQNDDVTDEPSSESDEDSISSEDDVTDAPSDEDVTEGLSGEEADDANDEDEDGV